MYLLKDTRQARSGRDRKVHLSADAERLVAAAHALARAGSHLEHGYWQRHLLHRIERLLDSGHPQTVHDALDRLEQADEDAYGALVESVEASSEGTVIEVDGQRYDVLLLLAPVVAWTRFRIPAGPIPADVALTLSAHWQAHLLAGTVRFKMMPCLYSVEQLPRDFGELRRLARKLGTAAVPSGTVAARPEPNLKALPETAEMLADGRFLMAAVVVPQGEAIFRWQQLDSPEYASREQCLEHWVAQTRPTLEALLPGCGFECLLPDAFHVSLREVDRRVRPYAVKAAVHFLMHALSVPVATIKATIAPFGESQVEEYRIGLSVGGSDDVAQGIVWPLLGPESESDDPGPLDTIRDTLREAGITELRTWSKLTEPDYCEDCSAPLYPNPVGEVVHAEMPADAEPDGEHFH